MKADRWDEIARICDAALQQATGERDGFVAAATAGDDELRREVESLLAHDSETCLLDRPALESAGGLLNPDVTLHPGAQLGPYRIEGVVGAGGMGHVYRATDTRLHRTVAIKVLRSKLANDPQFRERFEREAKAIAALAHPHICALHDVRSEGGVDFLVLEFLEGETLAARLQRGALPLDQALRHGIDIAGALATAHRSGIVHRDLKPGNIVLTRTGAKLLDFGLAKGVATPVSGQVASPAVLAQEVTAAGTILGTVQYMAPEQLEGRPADTRTDIFAFGAVLYQMIAGRRPFEGSSPASVIGAILKDDPPPLDQSQPLTPLLDHVVRRCLAKDPDERWQSAADLARELRWATEGASSTGTGSAGPSRPRVRRAGLVALAVVSLVAAGAAGALWLRRPAGDAPRTTRFEITVPSDPSVSGSAFATSGVAPVFRNVAIAHDGSRIVFRSGSNSQGRLALRSIDTIAPILLDGTAGANGPFFSPDDQWIAFHSRGRLRKVRLSGGSPIELCAMGAPGRGGAWLADGSIIFATATAATGLLHVRAEGGTPVALTTPDTRSGERDHVWPSPLSPHQVLFTILGASGRAPRVAVFDVNTRQHRVVLQNAAQAQYVEYDGTGYLLYESAKTVYGVRFDRTRLETRGEPTPIAADILTTGAGGQGFAASQEGTVVYSTAGSREQATRTMVWVDRDGREQALDAPPRAYMTPRLSPDGRRVAVVIADPQPSIWIWDAERRALTPLSPDRESGMYPVWTPGHPAHIVFMSEREGSPNVFRQAADGSVKVEHIASERPQFPGSLATNGLLFISELNPPTRGDIGVVDLSNPTRMQMLIQSRATEASPEISPDGRWLAYQSNESGIDEVWIRPFPIADGARIKVSTGGGIRPAWAPDAREIFYLDSTGHLTAARVTVKDGSLAADRPARLFETTYYGGAGRPFDVSPDGRFLMVKESTPGRDAASSPALTVVQNWFSELSRR